MTHAIGSFRLFDFWGKWEGYDPDYCAVIQCYCNNFDNYIECKDTQCIEYESGYGVILDQGSHYWNCKYCGYDCNECHIKNSKTICTKCYSYNNKGPDLAPESDIYGECVICKVAGCSLCH